MALTTAQLAAQKAMYLEAKMRFGFWSGDIPPTTLYPEINFTKLELTSPKQDTERLKSNMEGTVGQDLDTQLKPGADSSVALSAEFSRAPLALQALSLGADASAFTRAGGAVVDQAVTLAVGVWVPLWTLANGPDPLSSFDGLKDAGDATVDAAHYEVDLMGSMIMALDATGATGTKASFTKAAIDGVQMDAGQAKSEGVYLVGTATEKASGKRGILTIHRAKVGPSGAWDPVAGGYLQGALEGSCDAPNVSGGYVAASPYQFILTDIAA